MTMTFGKSLEPAPKPLHIGPEHHTREANIGSLSLRSSGSRAATRRCSADEQAAVHDE